MIVRPPEATAGRNNATSTQTENNNSSSHLQHKISSQPAKNNSDQETSSLFAPAKPTTNWSQQRCPVACLLSPLSLLDNSSKPVKKVNIWRIFWKFQTDQKKDIWSIPLGKFLLKLLSHLSNFILLIYNVLKFLCMSDVEVILVLKLNN